MTESLKDSILTLPATVFHMVSEKGGFENGTGTDKSKITDNSGIGNNTGSLVKTTGNNSLKTGQ